MLWTHGTAQLRLVVPLIATRTVADYVTLDCAELNRLDEYPVVSLSVLSSGMLV